jgi:hypothetical protein
MLVKIIIINIIMIRVNTQHSKDKDAHGKIIIRDTTFASVGGYIFPLKMGWV